MHRSRMPLLVIAVVVAACSKRDDSETTKSLSHDPALAARVENSQNTDQRTDRPPLPDACGTVGMPDQPGGKNKVVAAFLSRRASEAEILGNMHEAAELLRRASRLDGRDKSSAYHLGRVDEALGERAEAIKAYCRFLALGPTPAEQRDASQRLANLSQSQTQVAAATHSAVDTNTTRRSSVVATARPAARNNAAVERRVVARRVVARTPIRGRSSKQSTSIAAGAVDLPSRDQPATPPRVIVDRTDSVVAVKNADATPAASTVDSSTTAPPIQRRRANTVQAAGIGAVTGAIIGGVAGRSVKAAAIGAAAGGILGATVARGTRSPSRDF